MNRLQTMARWLAWSLLALIAVLPVSDANPLPVGPKAPSSADEDCLTTDPPPPVLKLKVRVPAHAPGELALVYKICVENSSKSEAHHVMVKDLLPPNAKFVRSDPEPSKIDPELQWTLGTIGAGAAREITLVLQPLNNADVKNCIRVQFEHGLCLVTRRAASVGPDGTPLPPGTLPPVSTKPDPPRINTDPPKVVPIPEEKVPGLARLKLDVQGNDKQYLNMASKYLITLKNTGDGKATNVLLTAKLSDKLKFIRASDKGMAVDDQVAWFLGDLEAGATRQIELVLRGEIGKHCLRVAARADRNVATLDETVCTTFVAASAMTLEMVDTADPILVGGKTTYETTIANQGTLPLRNVRLKARIPPSLKLLSTEPPDFIRGEIDAQGTWILFKPLEPPLGVGNKVRYKVNVEGAQVGLSRFRIEVTSDDLESGPVVEEESTRIYDDLPFFPGVQGKEPPR